MDYNNLTDKQRQAFDLMVEPRQEVTRVVGYAGTGKTTVLAAAANELGSDCVILSPTNKACNVLKEKGIGQAMTIHRCLYTPHQKETAKKDRDDNIVYLKDDDGEVLLDKNGDPVPETHEELKFDLKLGMGDVKFPLAIVDEASMVGEKLYNDLIQCFEKLVLVGDGFQLPPIKDRDILNEVDPDILLNEVHRTAKDNPITRYATSIRNGEEPLLQDVLCDEIKTCTQRHPKLFTALQKKDVQAICWSNNTRHWINEEIRKAAGLEPYTLINGEPVICNESVWDGWGDDRVLRFYNGEILKAEVRLEPTNDHFSPKPMNLIGQNKVVWVWPFWNKDFNDVDFRTWKNTQDTKKAKGNYRHGSRFDYAYCLTAHKSQGSEFKDVAVFDERSSMMSTNGKEFRQRWFYTAITRAKERILIVR